MLGRARRNTRGFPKGPAHGGGEYSYWDFTSREKKRAHHKLATARRRQSVAQRRGKRV
jgi:hypothetical protein